MAAAALFMLSRWIIEKYFNGAFDVPNEASVQLEPTSASKYQEMWESPAPVTLSYQIQQLPRNVGNGGGASITGLECSTFIFAWIVLCLSIGLCFYSLGTKETSQGIKTTFFAQVIAMRDATIAKLELAAKEKDARIDELTRLTDSLHDQANTSKAEARRYETLMYEMKSKCQYHMEQNTKLCSTITIPFSIIHGDTQERPDVTIPSGITNGGTQQGSSNLPENVDDNLQQPETAEDAPPKKSRNRRRRRNKRAMKPEPGENTAEGAGEGGEPKNNSGEDEE